MRNSLTKYLSVLLASSAAIAFSAAKPALADSEAGFIFIGGGDSESGGVAQGTSESGGVYGQGNESSSGGVHFGGGDSESGGVASVGSESESGGVNYGGGDTQSGGAAAYIPNYGIRNYKW